MRPEVRIWWDNTSAERRMAITAAWLNLPEPRALSLDAWVDHYYDAIQRPINAGHVLAQEFFAPVEQEEPDDMPANLKLVNAHKIGADPEFVVLDGKTVINAQTEHLMPQVGKLGWDHNGRVAEVHPAPSRHIVTLVKNMHAILTKDPNIEKLAKYKLRAGGLVKNPGGAAMGYNDEPLGGHVHFDLKYERPRYDLNSGANEYTKEFKDLINALDRVTVQLEGTDILPKDESDARRKAWRGLYGQMNFGDGHIRAAGRKPRIEYRAPASWLFDPKTALYVLTAYKLASSDPKFALETLSKHPSARELRRLFDGFGTKDDDARLVLEKFLQNGGLRTVRGDPDADIKETWRKLPI